MGGTGPLIGVLACGRCVQVNIQGNVMEGLGGPAIVVNDVLGLTIQANYFEGNDENAWRWGAPHHLTRLAANSLRTRLVTSAKGVRASMVNCLKARLKRSGVGERGEGGLPSLPGDLCFSWPLQSPM